MEIPPRQLPSDAERKQEYRKKQRFAAAVQPPPEVTLDDLPMIGSCSSGSLHGKKNHHNAEDHRPPETMAEAVEELGIQSTPQEEGHSPDNMILQRLLFPGSDITYEIAAAAILQWVAVHRISDVAIDDLLMLLNTLLLPQGSTLPNSFRNLKKVLSGYYGKVSPHFTISKSVRYCYLWNYQQS
jgi:hypothetical protein